jgi:glyoxylase-like metal-dependent hydrolase (beta-lactamase superfamily II)
VWGDLEWRLLAAPGHDMGALVFHNPEHGILVSGDALWENGYGFVMPQCMEPDALAATRATLDMIAGLDVRVVIPGHGDAFTDVDAALDRAYQRTDAYAADDRRMARYALKALLAFTLLARRSMRIAGLPAYVARIGVYRDMNEAVLRMTPEALAQMLVDELQRAKAARVEDACLVPA